MDQLKIVNNYIKDKFSNFKKENDNLWSFNIDSNKKFLCVVVEKNVNDRNLLFDKDFHLILSKKEKDINANYYAFNFGGIFYYIKQEDLQNTKLHILRYLGEYSVSNEDFVHLGIHSCYSLLIGCQKIESYIEKAKYLQMKALGICEIQSLDSAIKFQNLCLDNKIKPILGEEIKVKIDDNFYWYKLYVKNKNGWRNLINISNIINVFGKSENKEYIEEKDLRELLDDLICVVPNDFPFDKLLSIYKNFDCYYQIDTVEFLNEDYYYNYLNNIKKYIYNYSNIIKPVLIGDSYYLDKEDKELQNVVNKIGNIQSFKYSCVSQHFKSIDEHLDIFSKFWKNKLNLFDKIMGESINNTVEIAKKCNFQIKFEKLHIPMARISKKDWDNVCKEEKSYKN